ncbi:MAG: hypothetical protein IMW99_09865 [Firmicutes bacterium]|nr:hypothetical protein [Bacillota bacterium]
MQPGGSGLFGRNALVGFVIAVLVTWAWILSLPAPAAAEGAGATTCLQCHGQQGMPGFVDAKKFASSPHGALGCNACHTSVEGYPHKLPAGAKGEVAAALKTEAWQSCQNCHQDVTAAYAQSVHGATGLECSSCHGPVHALVVASQSSSPVAHKNIAATCEQCHTGTVAESYNESLHAAAVRLGSDRAATCSSCHGSHDVVLASAANSPVNSKNTPKTCARCHGTAAAGFAQGKEHVLPVNEGAGKPLFWTGKFFTWLTISVIVLLVGHMELELFSQLRARTRHS